MLLISLDPEIPTPAYLQIRDRIVALVEEGSLRPGDRLPPTRALARSAGVHRSTVVRAYDEVRALGYLESRSGSYSTIRRRARPPATAVASATSPTSDAAAEPGLIDWADRTAEPIRGVFGAPPLPAPCPPRAGTIDFERLSADPRIAPTDDLRRAAKSVLLRSGPVALDYSEAAGWHPLREMLSMRLRAHGVAVSADEILVTSGAQQALDLILRLLTRPGDRVAVEAPTYGMAHALFRLHGLVPVEIPMATTTSHTGEGDGMDLDRLEEALESEDLRLVYTMPNFHNPTGLTTDQAHRERLLAACEHRRVPIVEDGFEEEMKYFGQAVLPIKSIDARGIVLYVGTFSKVVFPGLRVGWIAAPRKAIERLTAIQRASCLSTNTFAQTLAERFCRRGELEAYLRRAHRVYRGRLQTLLDALARHMPPDVHWTRPIGGYTLWLTLPGSADAEPTWYERLGEAGVAVAPGRQFFGKPPEKPHVRLSIACVDEEEIEEGCRRLGGVLGAAGGTGG